MLTERLADGFDALRGQPVLAEHRCREVDQLNGAAPIARVGLHVAHGVGVGQSPGATFGHYRLFAVEDHVVPELGPGGERGVEVLFGP